MTPSSLIAVGALVALMAQDPASRIDDEPRVVFRPPVTADRPVGPPPLPVEAPPVETRADHDRRLDLDLELRRRREDLSRDGDGVADWLALVACLVAAAAILYGFVAYVARRRGR